MIYHFVNNFTCNGIELDGKSDRVYTGHRMYTEASFLVRQRRNLHVSEYDSPKNTCLCTRVAESEFPISTIIRNKAFEGNDNKCLAESRGDFKSPESTKKTKKGLHNAARNVYNEPVKGHSLLPILWIQKHSENLDTDKEFGPIWIRIQGYVINLNKIKI